MSKVVSMREVAKHNTLDDLWVVLHGKVYDLTAFIREHPGGIGPILNCAGKEGTEEFNTIHSAPLLRSLPASAYIADIDKSTITRMFLFLVTCLFGN